MSLVTDSISIADELRSSFRDYSLSVIIGRALPDVRDGLKPVHRRILYAMHREGLFFGKKFSKCAGVVGEVLKRFHPHGDSSVYDALVRMAQPWSMREILIDGQGNFGNIDGDPPAAYRYTEARLSKISEEMLKDIEKDTVDFLSNFDGSSVEPSVLPARYPNLLINGSEGIAVAMATKCPPHNLGEILEATFAVIDEQLGVGPSVDFNFLEKIVLGPDFPTGGYICGKDGVSQAIRTGRGTIRLRGKANVESVKNSKRKQIVIEEIPYQLNKTILLERIANLTKSKKIDGISDIRDESDRDGMRVVIDLRKDVNEEVILNSLYQHTPLQSNYSINMLAIVNGKPKILNLRELIDEFLNFRRDIVTRRSKFDLKKHQERIHALSGFIVTLCNLDKVIEIIRSSKNITEAKKNLKKEKFFEIDKINLFSSRPSELINKWLNLGYATLDDAQVDAVLDIRLSRLVSMEVNKITSEFDEILTSINELKRILSDFTWLMKIIKNELIDVKARFASPRRTFFLNFIENLKEEDLVDNKEMLVTVSNNGYIKRTLLSNYQAQNRGGKGKVAVTTKDNDFIKDIFAASNHAYLLIFTNLGRAYWLKVYELPQFGSQSKGKPMVNLVKMSKGESVKAILPVRDFPEKKGEQFVIVCTRSGKVKKTDLATYSRPRANGMIAYSVRENDELVCAKIIKGSSDIFISTRQGFAINFSENDVRVSGKIASGVRGIKLRADDEVVSMDVVDKEAEILTVTENGYGKRTAISRYPKRIRGGMGVINIKTGNRNGMVADAIQVYHKDSVMFITNFGKLIRIQVESLSATGRNTQGSCIISLNPEKREKVISAVRLIEETN